MVTLELFETFLRLFDALAFGGQVVGDAHERIDPYFGQLVHVPGCHHGRAMQPVDDARRAERFEYGVAAFAVIRQPLQRRV
jgi:hypothetical protein